MKIPEQALSVPVPSCNERTHTHRMRVIDLAFGALHLGR